MYWEMREWVLDYCIQYPIFQLPVFIPVADTYQNIYIPGKFRTRLFFILKISTFLIDLTDFSPGKIWLTRDFSATNSPTLE